MVKKNLKLFFCFAAPLLALILPLAAVFNIGKYFKNITLQPQKTGITTHHYYDVARNRPVITEIWYPVDSKHPAKPPPGFWMRCDEARNAPLSTKQKQYPLVMMSHGSGGDRYTMAWLAEVLAANGYIVAATDHFGNTWNNKILESYARPWERPQDISYALDQILDSEEFKDRIDKNRIGFAGYSLGGTTGMWIAGAEAKALDASQIQLHAGKDLSEVPPEILNQINFEEARGSYKDPRICAVLVMAPALGWMFEEQSLSKINVPVYIVAPETDAIVPTEKNARIFASKITKATLKILPGEATHYVFLNRANAIGKRFLEPKYCEDASSINRQKVHEEIAKNSIHFFDAQLR